MFEKLEAAMKTADQEIALLQGNEELKASVIESRIREIEARRLEQIKALRPQAEAEIKALELDHESRIYRAKREMGPKTAEEWQEAAVRAPFVSAEIEAIASVDAISERIRLARKAGDRVGAWLMGQAAMARARAMPSAGAVGSAVARAWIDTLEDELYGEARKLEAQLRADVDNYQRELSRLLMSGARPRFPRSRYSM